MNENEDPIRRLRAFGRRPVSPEVAGTHLAAMDEAVASGSRVGAHRLKIVAAFVVGLVAGTSGLATAGALPNGAQEVAHRTFGAVGIKVPHGDRYWGQECAGEVKKNHGQYVRSQPKDKRAEAAASRCGKPVQAGAGDEDRTKGGDGTGAGCQGPPPWAGKGKPDPASKAARKQACGQGNDEKESQPPGPSAQAEPTVPPSPDPSGANPSLTEPTTGTTTTTVVPSTVTTETTGTTTLVPSTVTTETTGTTTTTSPPATTSTTGGPDGD